MRRYLIGFDTSKLETIKTDVLVVGSGLAGLYAALHIRSDLSCTIISKADKYAFVTIHRAHEINGEGWTR